MAKGQMSGPETRLGFLDLLLIVCFSHTPGDAHSLSFDFTVDPQPRPGQLWCEIQSQLDGKVFLFFDCGHAKIILTRVLGEEVKTMKASETQIETLRDIRDWVKDQLHDLALEKRMAREPLTLQARMTCRYEDDRHVNGYWQFGLNGLMSLHFDSKNGHWRVDHPGGRWMKEKWENDRAVTGFLKKVSMGDCQAWLQDFMVRWKEILKTTASPTTVPPTVEPTAPPISHVPWITTGFLASFVIMGIVAWILYKKRKWLGSSRKGRSPTGETVRRGDCVPRKPLTGALLASGLSLCLAALVLLCSL